MKRLIRMFPMMDADGGANGGGDPNPTPDPKPEPDKVVPYDRFKAVNDEKKALADQLKALSAFGSPDDLAALKAEFDALKQAEDERKKAQMSELERIQAERDEKANEAAELAKQVADLAAARDNDRIENAVLAAAKDAVDPEAVLTFLDRAAVKIEDGKVVGVDEAVAGLKEKKPYLFTAAEPKKPKTIADNGVPPKQADKTAEQLIAEATERVKKFGRIEDRVALAELKAKLQK